MLNTYKQLLTRLMKYSVYGIIFQCIVLAPLVSSGAIQQRITVTGTVTSSDDGSALPGVNVVIKGTTQGTTTDADGKYSIEVSNGDATLVFSFIGYTPQEQTVTARTVIDVALVADLHELSEVVVVGYGTQQKVTLTGAVTSIKGDAQIVLCLWCEIRDE